MAGHDVIGEAEEERAAPALPRRVEAVGAPQRLVLQVLRALEDVSCKQSTEPLNPAETAADESTPSHVPSTF